LFDRRPQYARTLMIYFLTCPGGILNRWENRWISSTHWSIRFSSNITDVGRPANRVVAQDDLTAQDAICSSELQCCIRKADVPVGGTTKAISVIDIIEKRHFKDILTYIRKPGVKWSFPDKLRPPV
jgi:hypothetical protein